MPEDKVPFFSRTLFRFLVHIQKRFYISEWHTRLLLKEFPNDNFQKIYNALAKNLEEVLDAEYFN